ncbi:phospholipid:diacylglycerol acyltransferase 1 isoform X1 [Ricinus communis]|uniref:phospholipid:diacylglycerol acyltransferase n=2 Tax=Ricinus communis TaxID=3988 RepID=B9S5T1_RICCO|nr:phospholipid:diacylglycerol acyltransferase 1 [Ricinus communis]XP_015576113.1 phospholipid:diacylglycerol acyltransferase 1 isoform X1 [Ricinus communis]XP_015576114.1 phospholipid:diacylglycerol acyltransferase 1 isoform X1 [Ricinus communis]XP_015576115.1 phospholipid:diacylglycerol acyltransferase 1 isoform X1 [Ricinus communis]AEJ32005.1 phospholipid:diacylglycerol acyltransferase 1-1 [Ricinus communis]EEF41018.1 Phosphatidylcholine: Diacylglycerol Acyltransferase [Ricinus communis]|eukprot:NP_001310694.1 phospholipid:diacylglycerol acyltransferase 1 [Ricinus communis]
MPVIRRKKPTSEPNKNSASDSKTPSEEEEHEQEQEQEEDKNNKKKYPKKKSSEINAKKWSCIDSCCWFVGCICVTWWVLLFLYNAVPASLPQYVTEAITGPLPDPPGVKLKKEGLTAKHPVVFVPGIVTAGLELWEGHQCADGLFRKRLWGGTFGEVYKRPLCWVEHMSLDNETGLDPPGIRVRPVSGLVAADYFAPGYFVWAVLIANLARIGYEEKTMFMASYDWRLSFQNTEVRDQTLSRMKSNIELMVSINGGNKAVIVPHSMGVLYFLHFMKWVEAPAPMGGGGGPDWCAKHIKAVMNIGGPFLGVPKAVAGLFSAEARDIAVARAIAPGFLDNDMFRLQTLQHMMRMSRTWDSTMSMIPRGGDTIWGDLDWSPEEGYIPRKKRQRNNATDNVNEGGAESEISQRKIVRYGRMISFGKNIAEAPSYDIERIDFRDAVKGRSVANNTCLDVWTEYHEMGFGGIKAVAEYKVYTAGSTIELLQFVAPKMMERGSAHFSYGIADNLEDPKYEHYKYWSNPLETKLPNAPEMEIFSMYGVGIPTERAYVYEFSPAAECYIPFQIDTSANDGDEDGCLKDGVYTVDGDETVPVLSAGFMCAKAWRGKTRFNPSGSRTYIREYDHSPPANLLEGRGTQSGAHVDIMGNFALIEDIMRVAAGATGEDLGGDQVYSDIFKWSQKIKLPL